MTREQAVRFLIEQPYKLGHMVGFTDLTEMHNEWIKEMIVGKGDKTLQAHRGSFKTTCLSIALAILIVLMPQLKIAFFRKTDSDVREVIRQVKNILESPYMRYLVSIIYNVDLRLTEFSSTTVSTNLSNSIKGSSQLLGIGTSSSITGKHFDLIFTDDIVNVKDRVSRAERERTILFYQELQNIKNRGGRIYNTGTPWHKDDCFSIMPKPKRFDCYSTGLMTEDEIENIRQTMTASLFAANYELKHIADDDVIFTTPQKHADPYLAEQAKFCHLDAAYGGEDYTAFTICNKREGKYYVLGKMWRKHVDDCMDEIIALRHQFMSGKIMMETNGDKGYLAREFKKRGERVAPYSENMNKDLKITTYLKGAWRDVIFVEGTDESYIDQICDYNENAEHDDAPDSLASIVRQLWNKKDTV